MSKILIIEDDNEVIENLTEILELEDYQVVTAKNGLDGIKQAETQIPDLILCDISMPEMNGYEVVRNIRKNPLIFSTPLIFLTAKTEKSNQRLGMELGADDYITKPFDNKDILNSIKTRLQKHTKSKKYYEEKIENLAYNIATTIPHELRTPLNTILGFVQILKSNYKELPESDIDMMLGNIHDAGNRLLRLIVNYTYYAKLAGISSMTSYIPESTTQRSDEIINSQAISVAHKQKRENNLKLNVKNTSAEISPDHLGKLVEELVLNAFKFSDAETDIMVESKPLKNGFLEIIVTNTGRGMSQEQINNIGAFFQFERNFYEQQGSGLGLAIVKKIIDLYNGTLDIDSTPNKTTSVLVRLPLNVMNKN